MKQFILAVNKIIILVLLLFACLSCEKIDFPDDVPIAIKNLVRTSKNKGLTLVNEYKYHNGTIYTFDFPGNMSSYYKFDKYGNKISEWGGGGIAGRYSSDNICFDFNETAVFIRKIYPLNN
ncbi:MAG: hypothetical protein LBV69_00995 [Bacteroidales bacterium]|jgi:hypothetical protein|nr:hypothetical protein [Bacteroidales bacterium]